MQTVVEQEESGPLKSGKDHSGLVGFESSEGGRIRIFVRSRRVCVESKIVSFPSFAGGLGSNLSYQPRRVAVYEDVLDQEQKEALENCLALARSLGVKLEVKDVGRSNIFGRLLNFVLGTKVPSQTPSVSVSGKAVYLLARNPLLGDNSDRESNTEQYLAKLC